MEGDQGDMKETTQGDLQNMKRYPPEMQGNWPDIVGNLLDMPGDL